METENKITRTQYRITNQYVIELQGIAPFVAYADSLAEGLRGLADEIEKFGKDITKHDIHINVTSVKKKLNPCPVCGAPVEIIGERRNNITAYSLHCTNPDCMVKPPIYSEVEE